MKKVLFTFLILITLINCGDPAPSGGKPGGVAKEMVDINIVQPLQGGVISVTPGTRVEKGTDVTISIAVVEFEGVPWDIIGWGGALDGETASEVTITVDDDIDVSIELFHNVLQPVLALWGAITVASVEGDLVSSDVTNDPESGTTTITTIITYEGGGGGIADVTKITNLNSDNVVATGLVEIAFTDFIDADGFEIDTINNYTSFVDMVNAQGEKEGHINGSFEVVTPHNDTLAISIVNITMINENYQSGAFNVDGVEFAFNRFPLF